MTEIVNKDAIEKRDSKPINNRSRFNNSYRLAGTYRFGEYAPTLVADCVPDDNHKLKVSHVVKSYTMKQPLMQDIQLKDDTFLVPLSAILFRNYEKFITTPNIGDDVNSALVGTSVSGFSKKIYDYLSSILDSIWFTSDPEDPESVYLFDTKVRFEIALKYFVSLDNLCSSGSLMSSLGMPLVGESHYVDKVIDNFLSYISSLGSSDDFKASVRINGVDYLLEPKTSHVSANYISLREFWNRIHDTANWSFNSITDNDSVLVDVLDKDSSNAEFWLSANPSAFYSPDEEMPYDLARLYAYQICCAHFFSNDKVDYIYSANLWRENLRSFYKLTLINEDTGFVNDDFYWNGVSYFYDECSSYFVINFLLGLKFIADGQDSDTLDSINQFVDWVALLFAYRRSLRFVDYFTGSRTRPLAPGDASVSVTGGKIDVVETIQTKWFIRLWSQISRVGRKLSEQMQGLFPGVQPSVDWHEPIWLSHNDGKVMASEVDNTGANQFDEKTPIAVTSTLHGGSHGNNLNLTINDRHAIVITISYFDISRFYSRGIDRDILHVSRYDKFNPFLQFMGDQKVYLKELNVDIPGPNTFGYQGRYMEYKQRIDRAFGGLSNPEVLPAMIFLADFDRSLVGSYHISPDYIRSYPCELDRFFISLSGWSLGTYFHFIMVTNDEIDSSRPMAYNPQIQ